MTINDDNDDNNKNNDDDNNNNNTVRIIHARNIQEPRMYMSTSCSFDM